ncbi:PPE family protein [Mycobacteroides abscessus]|uniref:PPE family protein n=1 Tax=Mycobacteroides abscessus TaxID=36809 RepID=UPI0009A7CADE|nr:PPE family protein [Mycobacteroides abscessus]SKO16028.1 Conserved protein of uncharacterised function, PPE family [Mycobacteroides abscessus subsp. bolletii]SKX37092.1 Conserved protein of uncharacterised function, PPE family [Mycobacteroides abscessus subsp. bolletii]
MPGDWGARPPDVNSVSMWCGAGAETFFAAAGVVHAVAGIMAGLSGGHGAVSAAMGVAWMGTTGSTAVAANTPYQAWLGKTQGELHAIAGQIEATGSAFETSRGATPTPGEVAANQSEHVALNAANFLGMLTPLIVENRGQYFGNMWPRAAGSIYSYQAASMAGAQAIPPLDPPPPSGAPVTASPSLAQGLAGDKPISAAAGADPLGQFGPILQTMGQLPQQGSSLMKAPTEMLQGAAKLPQEAFKPFMDMFNQFGNAPGGMNGLGNGADAGNWLTSPPNAGGPVGANVGTGGAGGGFGGSGMSAASSAMRSPSGWSPTAGASAAGEGAQVSRFAEARASQLPASGAGGGAGMAPAAAGHGRDSDRPKGGSLADAAVLYREPEGIPVVSGIGGAVYGREGDATDTSA